MTPIVTLTTDFGNADGYVGQMKGVLLSLCPDLRVVDLSHEVPPQAVEAGAFLLETASAPFPAGTIHVAVVDPGVGTDRRRLVVRTAQHTFVLPDNGLVSRVLDREPGHAAWALDAAHYRRDAVSATFEGRDVFAPAAAWLARGVAPERFGPEVSDLVRLPASPVPSSGESVVPVVWVDRFGNVVLDVARAALPPGAAPRVRAAGGAVDRLVRTYGEGTAKQPVLLFGSAGYLEIAVREGRADTALGLHVGDRVTLLL
ncbi:MAG TPA: SAM-dependent chlorinase/fluorinase [Candidatus Polarisedimenticolaceae bacterium]|nr:SAM-dependent chlorinase/fluorinase [Candidatus Polarisedimenticolaceae bacterium]